MSATGPASRPERPQRRWTGVLLGVLLGALSIGLLGGLFLAAVFLFSDPAGRIRITEPPDDAVIAEDFVIIRGTSSPDWAGVYRVLGGGRREQVRVEPDGDWAYGARLVPGENRFTFHLDSHYGQKDSITIVYRPE